MTPEAVIPAVLLACLLPAQPPSAVEAVTALAREQRVLILGEGAPGLDATWELVARLFRDEQFRREVRAVVLPWANAAQQEVLDSFVDGGEVSPAELVAVWRSSVDARNPGWRARSEFLAAIRELNTGRAAPQRVRVVAGSPEFDWELDGLTPAEFRSYRDEVLGAREEFLAETVDRVAGDAKVLVVTTDHRIAPLAAAIGQEAKATIKHLHGVGSRSPEVAKLLAERTAPVLLRPTGAFGALDGGLLWNQTDFAILDGGRRRFKDRGEPWSKLYDGYVYLGESAAPRESVDDEFAAELTRRRQLTPGDARLPAGFTESMPVAAIRRFLDHPPVTTRPPRLAHPKWSAAHSWTVFDSPAGARGPHDLYVMSEDGSVVLRLTQGRHHDGHADWSPDGLRIAFESTRDGNLELYVMDASGRNVRRITDQPGMDYLPAFSPDGEQLAFASTRDGNHEIYTVPIATGQQRRITEHPARDWFPAWSPDGEHIAFSSDRDGDPEVYVARVGGSATTRLTDAAGADSVPSWSPDGRWLAFSSERDRNAEIYVMRADGSDVARLTRHPARDYSQFWSRDGRWLYFFSERTGEVQLFRVPPGGGEVERVSY